MGFHKIQVQWVGLGGISPERDVGCPCSILRHVKKIGVHMSPKMPTSSSSCGGRNRGHRYHSDGRPLHLPCSFLAMPLLSSELAGKPLNLPHVHRIPPPITRALLCSRAASPGWNLPSMCPHPLAQVKLGTQGHPSSVWHMLTNVKTCL